MKQWLFKPIIDDRWDGVLWANGAVAGTGVLVSWLFPTLRELVVFFALMLLASGPVSAFLPVASEPVLMVFGQLHDPLVLTLVGSVAFVLAEWLNYRLFTATVHLRPLERIRKARFTRRVSVGFRRRPFLTVFVVALTPIPLWVARTVAAVTRYSTTRFLAATLLGRVPRIWIFALLGAAIPVTGLQIVAVGVVLTVVVMWLATRRKKKRVSSSDPVALYSVSPPTWQADTASE